MYFDKHEGNFYFYDKKGYLIADYTNDLELIDPQRMLTVDEIKFITDVLTNNL